MTGRLTATIRNHIWFHPLNKTPLLYAIDQHNYGCLFSDEQRFNSNFAGNSIVIKFLYGRSSN